MTAWLTPDTLHLIAGWLMLLAQALMVGAAVLALKVDSPRLARLGVAGLALYGLSWPLQALAITGQMTEASWGELPGLLPTLLGKTVVGWMLDAGLAGWLLLLAAFAIPREKRRVPWRLALAGVGLLLTLYGRAGTGHAAEDGLFTTPLMTHLLHVLAGSLWAGGLLVFSLLPARDLAGREAAVTKHLSEVATLALMTIAFTGLADVIRMAEGVAGFWKTPYALALAGKVGLVALAVAMGGANRLWIMPRFERDPVAALRIFTRIARVESVVLLGVLMAAVRLAAQSPQG